MKILIIDDDPMIVEVWSMALKEKQYDVITASNGKDGITIAKEQLPDLILLDEIMPDMIGNDVLQALQSDAATAGIPVAVASNYSESQMMQDAIKHGAVDYILKYQVDPQDLIDKVNSLVQDGANKSQTG